jgi:hypothetical protein
MNNISTMLMLLAIATSQLRFRVGSIIEGAIFPELKKETKYLDKNYGEDFFVSTRRGFAVADGVSKSDFSSMYPAKALTLAAAEAFVIYELLESQMSKDDFHKDLMHRLIESLQKLQFNFIKNFLDLMEIHEIKEVDYKEKINKAGMSATFVGGFVKNTEGKSVLQIFQKGDSLAAVFRLSITIEGTYYYKLVYILNDQQFKFNCPFQFNNRMDPNNIFFDGAFEFEILEDDLVFFATDGFFDNIFLSFFEYSVNLLVYLLSNDESALDLDALNEVYKNQVENYIRYLHKQAPHTQIEKNSESFITDDEIRSEVMNNLEKITQFYGNEFDWSQSSNKYSPNTDEDLFWILIKRKNLERHGHLENSVIFNEEFRKREWKEINTEIEGKESKIKNKKKQKQNEIKPSINNVSFRETTSEVTKDSSRFDTIPDITKKNSDDITGHSFTKEESKQEDATADSFTFEANIRTDENTTAGLNTIEIFDKKEEETAESTEEKEKSPEESFLSPKKAKKHSLSISSIVNYLFSKKINNKVTHHRLPSFLPLLLKFNDPSNQDEINKYLDTEEEVKGREKYEENEEELEKSSLLKRKNEEITEPKIKELSQDLSNNQELYPKFKKVAFKQNLGLKQSNIAIEDLYTTSNIQEHDLIHPIPEEYREEKGPDFNLIFQTDIKDFTQLSVNPKVTEKIKLIFKFTKADIDNFRSNLDPRRFSEQLVRSARFAYKIQEGFPDLKLLSPFSIRRPQKESNYQSPFGLKKDDVTVVMSIVEIDDLKDKRKVAMDTKKSIDDEVSKMYSELRKHSAEFLENKYGIEPMVIEGSKNRLI